MTTSTSRASVPLEESLRLDNGGMDETGEESEAIRKMDSRFSCNVCLEPVTEPVVTQCGHLYCWPCLYRWLEPGILPEEAFWNNGMPMRPRPIDESRRCCPVCKASCSVPTLVPIFVRNEPSTPIASSASRKRCQEQEDNEEEKDRDVGLESDDCQEQRIATPATESDQGATEPIETPSVAETAQPQQELRQRLRFRSRDSEILPVDDIPARPAAVSPTSRSTATAVRSNAQVARSTPYRTPLSPTPQNRASLSHGLLFLFQQAVQSTAYEQQQDGRNGIPSLHRRDEYHEAGGRSANQGNGSNHAAVDETTEFLSRLLLMLGSFVILCLLIF